MKTHTATTRVSLTEDGRIVPHTDPAGVKLFAGVGATKTDEDLKQYPNAAEFFDGFDKKGKDSARVEAKDEEEKPKASPKRAAKIEH